MARILFSKNFGEHPAYSARCVRQYDAIDSRLHVAMDRLKQKRSLSPAGGFELLLLFAIAALAFALLDRMLFPDEDLNAKMRRFYHQVVTP
jgi:hypothetical protein